MAARMPVGGGPGGVRHRPRCTRSTAGPAGRFTRTTLDPRFRGDDAEAAAARIPRESGPGGVRHRRVLGRGARVRSPAPPDGSPGRHWIPAFAGMTRKRRRRASRARVARAGFAIGASSAAVHAFDRGPPDGSPGRPWIPAFAGMTRKRRRRASRAVVARAASAFGGWRGEAHHGPPATPDLWAESSHHPVVSGSDTLIRIHRQGGVAVTRLRRSPPCKRGRPGTRTAPATFDR
jgi:hypothetical protein